MSAEESKYYIPDISEFHVGFEYEIRDWWTMKGMDAETGVSDYSGFTERVLTKEMLFCVPCCEESFNRLQDKVGKDYVLGIPGPDHRDEWERITTGIKDGSVRVKYLDKDDIESFGFSQITDECFNLNFENYRGRDKQEIRILIRETVLIYLAQDEKYNDANTITLFTGRIKNKSELKKLLTQLEIL